MFYRWKKSHQINIPTPNGTFTYYWSTPVFSRGTEATIQFLGGEIFSRVRIFSHETLSFFFLNCMVRFVTVYSNVLSIVLIIIVVLVSKLCNCPLWDHDWINKYLIWFDCFASFMYLFSIKFDDWTIFSAKTYPPKHTLKLKSMMSQMSDLNNGYYRIIASLQYEERVFFIWTKDQLPEMSPLQVLFAYSI